MLAQRILTGLIGIPIGAYLAYQGGWWLFGAIAVLLLKGQNELFGAAGRRGCSPNSGLAYFFGLGLLCIMELDRGNWERCVAISIAFVAANLIYEIVKPSHTHFADVGVTLTAFFYVGWLFGYLMLLRYVTPDPERVTPAFEVDFGWLLLLYTVAVTWIADTGAYFVGRAAGRNKLAPKVSPGKTVEGSYGGLLAAISGSLLLGTLIGLPIIHCAILGALMGVAGQAGDLAKSVMKREAGIKDFGGIFPGHGGVLDRFDAVLFNGVLVYYYVTTLLTAAAV